MVNSISPVFLIFFAFFGKFWYNVSCDLSAISAPIGTGRHRYRHLVPVPAPVPLPAPAPAPLPAPAPTGPDRHRPARAGTKRHRPAQTSTDRHRPAQDRHGPAPCRHDINFDYLVVNNDNYKFLKFFFHLNRSKSQDLDDIFFLLVSTNF